MDDHNNSVDDSRRRVFASPTRLLVFAVLLPAAVAIFNQVLFATATWHSAAAVYASMVASIAVLSWCVGRYLHSAWLRWLIFVWSLALLDLLTIAACLSGPLPNDFAFVLVSAQVSLLVLWTILAPVDWQWRLPGTVVGASLLIVFAKNWYGGEWGVLMLFSAVIVALVCGGLRWFGFALRHTDDHDRRASRADSPLAQFGIKHLLAWATALAPLLLVARGFDFLMFARLDGQSVFPATLLSLGLATVNLIVIWAILGGGAWPLRIALLLLVPFFLGIGLRYYAAFYRPPLYVPWPRSPVLSLLIHMEDEWPVWAWLNATLLAALLLFIRASGYRLVSRT